MMNRWIVMGFGSLVVTACLWTGAMYTPAMAQEDEGILDRIKRRLSGDEPDTATASDSAEAGSEYGTDVAADNVPRTSRTDRTGRNAAASASEDLLGASEAAVDVVTADESVEGYDEPDIPGYDEPDIPRGMRVVSVAVNSGDRDLSQFRKGLPVDIAQQSKHNRLEYVVLLRGVSFYAIQDNRNRDLYGYDTLLSVLVTPQQAKLLVDARQTEREITFFASRTGDFDDVVLTDESMSMDDHGMDDRHEDPHDMREEALERVIRLRRQLADRRGSRGRVLKSLREASEDYFAADLEFRREELEAVREQLEEMERQLERRVASKRRIIDLQMTVWQHEAEGLGFFSPEDQIGPMHLEEGMDMDEMMDDEYGISDSGYEGGYGPGDGDMGVYIDEEPVDLGDYEEAHRVEGVAEGFKEDREDILSGDPESQQAAIDRLRQLHRRGYISRQELTRIMNRLLEDPAHDATSNEFSEPDGPAPDPNQNIITPDDPDQNVIVPTEPAVESGEAEELPPPVSDLDETTVFSTAPDPLPLSDEIEVDETEEGSN